MLYTKRISLRDISLVDESYILGKNTATACTFIVSIFLGDFIYFFFLCLLSNMYEKNSIVAIFLMIGKSTVAIVLST